MDWRDEGLLIAVRRHGESSAIVEVLTRGHGRHAGVVRGGAGRRMAPLLQPGARLSVEWTARLEDHIGTFRVDPIGSRTAAIMADGAALAALGAMTALVAVTLPERDSHPELYGRCLELVDALGVGADWGARYAAWELALLAELGFGLDLERLRGHRPDGGTGLGVAEVGAGGQPGGGGGLGGQAAGSAGFSARRLGGAAGRGGGGGGVAADRLLPRGAGGAGAAARGPAAGAGARGPGDPAATVTALPGPGKRCKLGRGQRRVTEIDMTKRIGRTLVVLGSLWLGLTGAAAAQTVPSDGSVLPFPPAPMAGKAAPRLQDSTMIWPDQPQRLPKDAPNILIVLLDDVGFGVAETFGGEVHTPTLDRLAAEGISYNGFNTTSICSPTRASLLTGRNHTRVGVGTIAERAVAFDGYTGVIPKNAATIAEVLKNYGYHTAAFGKWHNTPAIETTAIGPKDRWPNGYGFEYFYGFLGGETSQWEPRLTENYDAVEPPHDDPNYHLTSDMVDKALEWLDDYRAFDPGQAVLHVLGARRRARPAPCLQGMGGQVQGQVRQRLGRLSRARLQAPARDGRHPARHRADAARPDDGVVGQHPRGAAAVPGAADGTVCRLRRAYRHARSAG